MNVENSLTKSKGQQRLGLTAYLTQNAVKDNINQVLGGKNGQRFISAIVSAVNNNPALQECTNQSILSAALLGESLNLSPSPQLGLYYLVPFKDTKAEVTVAQFQLGYKGYIQLAIRSGQYKKLNVLAIKEGELISYDPLEEEIKVNLIDDEEAREKAETVGYYATFTYLNGFKKSLYWSKAKMEAHAMKYSAGYRAKKGFTFWEKDFDGMAFKTMIRQLISKWGLMSTELQTAFDADMAVIKEDGAKIYVDNEPEAIEAPAEQKAEESAPKEEPKKQAKKKEEAPADAASALFG